MTEETQPLHPGCIRIIVWPGEREGGGDFLAETLPDWIDDIEATIRVPVVAGMEEATDLARKLAFEAAKRDEWDIACIAALWIALFAPAAAGGVSLDDLMKLANVGIVTITASADGCTWRCEVIEYGKPDVVLH